MEYGLLIGAIAAVIVVAAFAIGRIVSTGYADTCTRLDAEMTAVSETCA